VPGGFPEVIRQISEFLSSVKQPGLPFLGLEQPEFGDLLPDVARIRAIRLPVVLPEFQDVVERDGPEIESNRLLIKRDHMSR